MITANTDRDIYEIKYTAIRAILWETYADGIETVRQSIYFILLRKFSIFKFF